MAKAANFEDVGYLRVLTPQTTDGANLKINKLDKVVFKETRLPLTAKKHLELENEGRPDHLKHKLEIVAPVAKALEVKKGPGRPPKSPDAPEGEE